MILIKTFPVLLLVIDSFFSLFLSSTLYSLWLSEFVCRADIPLFTAGAAAQQNSNKWFWLCIPRCCLYDWPFSLKLLSWQIQATKKHNGMIFTVFDLHAHVSTHLQKGGMWATCMPMFYQSPIKKSGSALTQSSNLKVQIITTRCRNAVLYDRRFLLSLG